MNRYDKESLQAQEQRDASILLAITVSYESIREKTHKIASKLADKTDDNPDYLTERAGRKRRLAKDLNEELRPEYLKRDKLIKDRYAEEYRTSYFYSKYAVENQAISKGYKVKLPRYTKKQFKDALNYPLSKLTNDAQMITDRNVDIQQLYTTIVSGTEQGLSLPKINREIDIKLGFRDSKGKWIGDPKLAKSKDPIKKAENAKLRKGQQYRTQRILRTEIGRIRSTAQTDQWIQQQEILPSRLIWVATLDSRTRSQSASMDGQAANKKGEFRYPNGTVARQRQSGNPAYDINDRCTTVVENPEYPPETRTARDPKTGKNKIVPYQNFETWAKDQKPPLRRNKYHEWLF